MLDNLFGDRDAIEVSPNLTIEDKDGQTLYIIDSGETDLNRTISRNILQSSVVNNSKVSGFDKLMFFKNQEDLNTAIIALKSDSPVINSTPDVQPFALVSGEVSIEGSTYHETIARPIYQVFPNKKGEYLPINDIRSYVQNTWVNTVKDALFSSAGTEIANPKKRKSNEDFQTLMLKITLIFCFIVILFLSAVAYAKVSKHTANSSGFNASSLSSNTQNETASNSKDPFTTLQYNQTKELLKKMNVDLDNPNSNAEELSCFTK